MPFTIPSIPSTTPVFTGDDYTAAATIQDVWGSRGGYATISVADVLCELQYGTLGESYWTDPFHVQEGGMELEAGTIGIKFRSFQAGTPAAITAGIFGPKEPVVALSATGASGPPTIVTSAQVNGVNGTPTPIHAASLSCQAVAIKADPANVGKVYVGDHTVTTLTGLELAPDDGVAFDISNLDVIFFDVDRTGEGLSWLAVS